MQHERHDSSLPGNGMDKYLFHSSMHKIQTALEQICVVAFPVIKTPRYLSFKTAITYSSSHKIHRGTREYSFFQRTMNLSVLYQVLQGAISKI